MALSGEPVRRLLPHGIRLAYERHGSGEPVLFVMGTGAAGRVWTVHQTPAVVSAGYQAITFDNRGIPPSDRPPGRYSLADMVRDTRGLIEGLALAPCRVVGVSLGALIAQELLIQAPHLVRCAVLMSTKARSDAARSAHEAAHRALAESGVQLPPEYAAAMSVFQMLSPATLDDENAVSLWLDVFQLPDSSGGVASGQTWAGLAGADRRPALRNVTVPCRVIAFSDDLVTPPLLGAEVAEAIPDCDFVEIASCGHLGYLERPEEVNAAIIEFLHKNDD
ncbi:alpha/beta fold hydrolase [Streptomyces fuscichromogenes]|uniref:Hydrolase, alpha/beta fold protein n=1 Tax=Streptomyces fuscichromogenes TaxID=1324013 RepID=A0A918CX09_9ACTN|nr:alpha/beta fold hydrolase [Streptomyces fuscichromogenes]GGN42520.1 putative hydrolase, alpha/beta fold protein [Streptomyces fuscichromogenes]